MTSLYRLFDARGRLLYVGVAVDVSRRLKHHRFRKSWWTEVASWTSQEFETRGEALAAEACVIRGEDPVYNVLGSRTRRRRMRTASQLLVDKAFLEKLYRKAFRRRVEIAELIARLPSDRP